MITTLRSSAGAWWAVLVAATLVSWWLGTDHGVTDPRAGAALLLTVALAKVWVIGTRFMELRSADPRLYRAFQSYTIVVTIVLIGMVYIR